MKEVINLSVALIIAGTWFGSEWVFETFFPEHLLRNATPVPAALVQYGVSRFEDQEAGVICWIYNQGGISCLPIEQTDMVP